MELREEWSCLALDHLPVGLLVINRQRKIRIFNQAMSRFTGLKSENILGQSLSEFLDDQLPDFNILLQTLTTGKAFQNVKPEAVISVAFSTACLVDTHAVRNRTGITVGAMAMFSPAGRMQEMENAIIKAEKLAILGQLAAGMVHEIRNPLTAIGGFLQLLQKYLKGNPKEEYIPIMLAELKHTNRLISEFLQLAKPGYARRTSCSIVKIINDVIMLMESEALLKKLNIEVDNAVDIPLIVGDSEQLKQVFINIFNNAFDALTFNGKVFVQTSWDRLEGFVKVAFRDTGVGIDEQAILTMFDPFFTTKEHGTGLGMFTSKKIIDNHGGRIEVQSKPGMGTTVIVFLPVEQIKNTPNRAVVND